VTLEGILLILFNNHLSMHLISRRSSLQPIVVPSPWNHWKKLVKTKVTEDMIEAVVETTVKNDMNLAMYVNPTLLLAV
jgi:hypothetical protein